LELCSQISEYEGSEKVIIGLANHYEFQDAKLALEELGEFVFLGGDEAYLISDAGLGPHTLISHELLCALRK
jgi:hypothetical protein